MSTNDCIMALFVRVDEVLGHLPQHPQATLHPSAIVTLALLFALKGRGPRACYRWGSRAYRDWFPGLPERTRLFRLLHHAEVLNINGRSYRMKDRMGADVRPPTA